MFYKEDGFKIREIGKIPNGWRIIELKNKKYIKKILTGGTPLKSKKEYWNGGNIPWLTNEEVQNDKINYISKTKTYITEKALKETNIKLIPPRSVILSLTASVGKVVINEIPITTNQQFNAFIINLEKLYPEYLAYTLLNLKKKIEQLAGITTFKFISKTKISELKILLPPLTEQKAIVQVLKDVDDLIEIVENQIKTLQRIKRALMEKYFSEGVFKHKEFRKTKIGRIPKEWEVNKLGNVAKIIMGQSPPSTTYNTQGIGMPFLQGKAEFGNVHPSETKYTTKPLKIAKIGSVLISVRAPVGDVNIADKEYCIGRGLASIKVLKVDNFFLFYFLHKERTKLQQCSCGSTFQAIKKEHLENFLIPLPPIEEQKEIAHRLKEIDEVIENRKKEKEHLIRIKKKMMDLLLTGKVRIMEC